MSCSGVSCSVHWSGFITAALVFCKRRKANGIVRNACPLWKEEEESDIDFSDFHFALSVFRKPPILHSVVLPAGNIIDCLTGKTLFYGLESGRCLTEVWKSEAFKLYNVQ